MTCKITSVSKTVVYDNVQSVVLPALSGQMQILPGHAEAFISLQKGNIILQRSGQSNEILHIDGGQCFFKENAAVIIL